MLDKYSDSKYDAEEWAEMAQAAAEEAGLPLDAAERVYDAAYYLNEALISEGTDKEIYFNISQPLFWKKFNQKNWENWYLYAYTLPEKDDKGNSNREYADRLYMPYLVTAKVKSLYNSIIKGKMLRPAKQMGINNFKAEFEPDGSIRFYGITYDNLKSFIKLMLSLNWPWEWTKSDFCSMVYLNDELIEEKGFGSKQDSWNLHPSKFFNEILDEYGVK